MVLNFYILKIGWDIDPRKSQGSKKSDWTDGKKKKNIRFYFFLVNFTFLQFSDIMLGHLIQMLLKIKHVIYLEMLVNRSLWSCKTNWSLIKLLNLPNWDSLGLDLSLYPRFRGTRNCGWGQRKIRVELSTLSRATSVSIISRLQGKSVAPLPISIATNWS